MVAEKQPQLDRQSQLQIARKVGIGAVKYADLSQNRVSDYVFSWQKMLSLEGNTAPYMQYAYARICSIFRKGELDLRQLEPTAPALTEPSERRLAIQLLRYGEIVHQAADEYRPNLLTSYLYELANRFSRFYEGCPVLKAPAELRAGRLTLCKLTAMVIEHGLSLLGIETLQRM